MENNEHSHQSHHSHHSSSSHHHSGEGHSEHSEHRHSHSHSGSGSTQKAQKALKICIGLNAVYLIAEALIGMKERSLSLLTDAGYNLGDILVLGLAYFSLKLKSIPSYQSEAFSYKKNSALSLLINSAILLVAVGFVSLFAWNQIKMGWQHCSAGLAMAITAGVGIIVNGLTAWILHKNAKKSSSMKSAFINMAADTFVSVVVMIAGIVLLIYPACTNADPIATLVAAFVILCFTVKLLYGYLKKGFLLFPEKINTQKVLGYLQESEHVVHVRHLNIWTNHADEVEVSAHLSLDDMDCMDYVKKEIKHNLRRLGVDIVTLSFKKHKE